MVKLYKIKKDSKPIVVKPSNFDDEVFDMETFIINNLSIIGEFQFLKKEATIGTMEKRPDILAVDEDGRLVIIELKNVFTGTEILEQIINYQNELRNMPDTVRKYYLEAKEIHDKINLDTSLEPRVIVIAPEIEDKLISIMGNGLSFQAEGIEVKRFEENNETFVIVNHKEHQERRVKESISRGEYNFETIAKDNKIPDKIILKLQELVEKLERFWDEENLNVKKKFNKNYIAFKHESSNICHLTPWADSIEFGVNISDESAEIKSKKEWKFDKPKKFWWTSFYEDDNLDLDDLKDILKISYELH